MFSSLPRSRQAQVSEGALQSSSMTRGGCSSLFRSSSMGTGSKGERVAGWLAESISSSPGGTCTAPRFTTGVLKHVADELEWAANRLKSGRIPRGILPATVIASRALWLQIVSEWDDADRLWRSGEETAQDESGDSGGSQTPKEGCPGGDPAGMEVDEGKIAGGSAPGR